MWWFHGPSHPRTRQSVASINKLHAYHARRHPGTFAAQEDYVFTLAFSAASLHRFNLKVGLPGYTEKQKIAAHLFWKHMADLFVDEHGQTRSSASPTTGTPSSLSSRNSRAGRGHPATEGEMVTKAIMDQFAFRFFPGPLHGFGRALAASTLHPNCWATHQVEVPPAVLRRILLRAAGLLIRTGQVLAPDPEQAYYEELASLTKQQRIARSRKIRTFDEEFSRAFRRRHSLPPRQSTPRDDMPTEASFAEL